MERALNPKDEKQAIYEIYRACRLCGAGAGYKMPIIQSVIDLEGDGIELSHKIKECVQIEVNHIDRMPPLICELCVDKVNDFYQFQELCKQTNRRTRLRLGLPLQTRARGSDGENSIPMDKDDSDGESSTKTRRKKTRANKESTDVKLKLDNARWSGRVETKPRDPSPVPKRSTRQHAEPLLSPQPKEPPKVTPPPKVPSPPKVPPPSKPVKPILKKTEEITPPAEKSKLKRTREKDIKIDTPPPAKKVKLAPESAMLRTMPSKPGPKSSKNAQKEPPPARVTPKQTPRPASKKDPHPPPLPKSTPAKSSVSETPTPKISMSKTLVFETTTSKTTSKTSASKTSVSKTTVSKTSVSESPTSKTSQSRTPVSKTPASRTPVSKTSVSKTSVSTTPTSKISVSKTSVSKTSVSETPASKTSVSKPSAATPEPWKKYFCKICSLQLKTIQGLIRHNSKHTPSFTSPKLACNACEAWFRSSEEARAHHRLHSAHAQPYRCSRCYGYFKLQQAYDDHFAENLCLSVYEVPDTKCWECWQTFPTNKLMEEHRCLGEDGRPGGKCNRCSRSYSLLKNLLRHESSCTYRNKGEVSVDPEVQASLLPMQVRIVKCDPLLRRGGHVDVARLSHTYGLDSKCRYPYLPARGACLKSEPPTLNRADYIEAPVNKELIADSHARWDTNDSDNSDSVDSQMKVDSLSSMSLKSINSKKCVGPSKKRKQSKVRSEDELDVDLDLGKKIDNILDNLANEDEQTSCDSDSILDKNVAKASVSILDKGIAKDSDSILDKGIAKDSDSIHDKGIAKDSDSILDKNIAEDGVMQTREEAKSVAIDDNRSNNDSKDVFQTSHDSDSILNKNNDKKDETIENDTPEKMDLSSENNDVITDKLDESSKKLDVTPDKLDVTSNKLNVTSDNIEIVNDTNSIGSKEVKSGIGNENDESIKERDNETKSVAENDEDSNDTKINDENGMHDDLKESRHVGTLNSDERNDKNEIDICNNADKIEEFNKELSKTKNDSLTNEDVKKNDNVDRNNQLVDDGMNEDTLASSVREPEDELGISNLVSDNIVTIDYNKMNVEENDHIDDTASTNVGNKHFDTTHLEKFNENDNFSKIDEITNKILKENENTQENFNNDFDDKHKDERNDENRQKSDPRSDSISLNSVKSFEINGFDVRDKFNVDDLSDEDKKLMAELDAQIGENDKKDDKNNYGNDQKIDENDLKPSETVESLSQNDQNVKENDQKTKEHLIDNLLKKQDDLNSLELDAVSDDEFNFDV